MSVSTNLVSPPHETLETVFRVVYQKYYLLHLASFGIYQFCHSSQATFGVCWCAVVVMVSHSC